MFTAVFALMLLGFGALVAALVTDSVVWAWVCLALCGAGVVLLAADTWRGRRGRARAVGRQREG